MAPRHDSARHRMMGEGREAGPDEHYFRLERVVGPAGDKGGHAPQGGQAGDDVVPGEVGRAVEGPGVGGARVVIGGEDGR